MITRYRVWVECGKCYHDDPDGCEDVAGRLVPSDSFYFSTHEQALEYGYRYTNEDNPMAIFEVKVFQL